MSITGTQGANFASELMLNKMMNGQARAENGNTVTAGLRASSAGLSVASADASVTSAILKSDLTHATAIQNSITELKVLAEKTREAIQGVTNADDWENLTSESLKTLENFMNHLGTQTVDGQTVFASGAGATSSIYAQMAFGKKDAEASADSGTASKSTFDYSTAMPAFDISSISFGDTEALDDYINQLNGALAASSLNVQIIENRSSSVANTAQTYSYAAENQILYDVGTSNGLLGNLVG